MRPSALPLVLLALVACVGDDPPPSSGSSGTSGTSGTSGGTGTRSINCDAKNVCKGTDRCCGIGTDWIGSSCKGDCAGAYELACDDAADCGTGEVCCYVSDGGARVKLSYCKSTCTGIERQLCKPGGSECRTGSCVPFVNHSPEGLSECQ
jgi:hypothetical protein